MSVNKVILLGHTGKDPDVKDVAGTKVANLSLATTEKGYTLQTGSRFQTARNGIVLSFGKVWPRS